MQESELVQLRKKVKVEITDDDGTTYSFALQGSISQNKVLKMMELIDQIGEADHKPRHQPALDDTTTYGRLMKLILESYQLKEFSSADIARDYEDKGGVPIPLSTVSTYLSRLADKKVLTRQKFGNSWVYRVAHVSSDQLAT